MSNLKKYAIYIDYIRKNQVNQIIYYLYSIL